MLYVGKAKVVNDAHIFFSRIKAIPWLSCLKRNKNTKRIKS